MTAGIVHGSAAFAEPTLIVSPTVEHDTMRGRKRDRSMTRRTVRSIRCAPSDECSTLRGRSRRRATSPALGYSSRTTSPGVSSPTRRRLLQVRLRREHCPSRVASPVEQQQVFRRRQRTRSRSRGPRADTEPEPPRLTDVMSGLRNELLASSDDDDGAKQ
ncbi:hypothetical protein B0J13DRAFT_620422 [Dactylonectria estremocensis]|uniref:Uncharacterized protein n=1 Tax=Dactylonectria estremocensis TaxID=1079267 RepID=A0A9P9F1I6_9HYPO|nr:hypothetical protein B0J13DRAFT_620422 [Dactylonectria estremocensis]